jgi:hypothetical protein
MAVCIVAAGVHALTYNSQDATSLNNCRHWFWAATGVCCFGSCGSVHAGDAAGVGWWPVVNTISADIVFTHNTPTPAWPCAVQLFLALLIWVAQHLFVV